jgi:inosine/xanthosine triphosphate pyrophosphatase family protein
VDRDLEGQPGLLSENLSKKQTNKKKTKQIYKRINYKKEKPQIE